MLKKFCQRLSDPIFYRKTVAQLAHPFRKKRPRTRLSLSDLPIDRVLVVVAHPDDEVFCSGLICELRERFESEIHILCLTKGEGGPLPEGVSREELGEIRASEMRKSCDILGVSKLTFLGHNDPVATEFKTFAPDVSRRKLARQIRGCIDGCQPDLIVTHGSWGEYWHPAHLLVHKAVMLAARETAVVTFKARQESTAMPKIHNHADPPHIKLDVGNHFETRLDALEAHESQLELFAEFSGGSHAEFVRGTSRENYSVKNLPVSER